MNAEQTSDDQALERRIATKDKQDSVGEDASDEEDEERYFTTVARPLGEAALSAQLLGSTLISEDRGE